MRILYTERHFDEETPITLQKNGIEVFCPKEEMLGVHEFGRAELIEVIKDIQPDILVVGLKFKIDQELLDLAPIKAVFTRTTATDHITGNVEVIKLEPEDLGDVVAVPEIEIGKMIELLRMGNPGYELRGKTLGIIGYGRIGKILADRAISFGMNIIFNDINQAEWYQNHFMNRSLEKLLKESDIVSLNITASEENRNFMNLEKFKQMKDGAWFLNSARPWLVDTEALKWALDNKLNGVWVDFEMPFTRDNLITTPHIGGSTYESAIKTEKIIMNKILNYVNKIIYK